MRNVISPAQVKTYLSELHEDEVGLRETAEAYQAARDRYQMRLLRYQALRTYIEQQFGESPYARPDDEWPEPDYTGLRGIYRFTGMKLGDAIVQILQEANSPLSMEEIIDRLSRGGAGQDEPAQPRAVTAALTHTTGIAKYTKGPWQGCYVYNDPDKEHEEQEWRKAVDDLPFE